MTTSITIAKVSKAIETAAAKIDMLMEVMEEDVSEAVWWEVRSANRTVHDRLEVLCPYFEARLAFLRESQPHSKAVIKCAEILAYLREESEVWLMPY